MNLIKKTQNEETRKVNSFKTLTIDKNYFLYKQKNNNIMKEFGYVFLIAGLILGIYALTMDTSVSVDYLNGNSYGLPARVNNLGLMSDRQNYLIFSGILVILGTVLTLSTTKNVKANEVENSRNKVTASSISSVVSNTTRYENLEKIGVLLEKGIINKLEFEIEKEKIISETTIIEEKESDDFQKTELINYVKHETDKGIVEIAPCINLYRQKAYMDGKPAPNGRYKRKGWLLFFQIKDGIIVHAN